jgi:hypothetical protein
MRLARTIMAMPLLFALPNIAIAQSPAGTEADVSITTVNLMRPAAADAMRPARTQISIHVALPTENVVGLGAGSRITQLEDDTGHSLLAEHGPAEEDQTEPFRAPPGLTWRYPSPPGAADGFLRRDDFSVGGREGWLEITVDAPELPAIGASQLTIAGEIEVLVAGEEEVRHQVHGIDLSDGSAEFEVGEETLSCMRDRSLTRGDLDISEYYCWSRRLQPSAIEVIDQTDAPSPPRNRANLMVVGDAGNLSLDVTFPATETVPVLVTEIFGMNL